MDSKSWFYHDWFQAYGPYTKQEIIQLMDEREIKKDFHLWHEGLEDWICIKNIDIHSYIYPDSYQYENAFKELPVFNPRIFKGKKAHDYEKGKSCVKSAGILLVIVGILWGVDSLKSILFGVFHESGKVYLTLGWNTVVSVVTVIIGLEIIKIKRWSYSWGVGTALLNLMIDLRNITDNGSTIKLFFIPLYLSIIILLFNNEKIFKEIEKERATDD